MANEIPKNLSRAFLQAEVQFGLVSDIEKKIEEEFNLIAHELLRADVNFNIVNQMKREVEEAAGLHPSLVQEEVFSKLYAMMSLKNPTGSPLKGQSVTVMLVGLPGSGITTTCFKYAKHYMKLGWKPVIVCADKLDTGMYHQLQLQASKENILLCGSFIEPNPAITAAKHVKAFKDDFDLVIIDTNGRYKQGSAAFKEMQEVYEAAKPDLVVFVMDNNTGQAASDQAIAFKECIPVGAVIITKMDGQGKGGGVLSTVTASQCPVIFIGTGQNIDDFEVFTARPFINRLMGIDDEADVAGSTVIPLEFTLRKVYNWYGKAVAGGQGFPRFITQMMQQANWRNKMMKSIYIMDSMTNEELDSSGENFNESRVQRIARGSGRQISEVQELLAEFKSEAEVWKVDAFLSG